MPTEPRTTGFIHVKDTEFSAVAADEQRLEAIADRVATLCRETTELLIRRGRDEAGVLQQSLERDVHIDELGRKLQRLDRMGAHACLGFMLTTTGERIYIGRMGLRDEQGEHLLLDWRTPAATAFFAATYANPSGLAMRRRYIWRGQRVTQFVDEIFDPALVPDSPAADPQSALIASLGSRRTGKMHDVLATLQADQDAVIRSSAEGALVVEGGPGTGKTVVALHRAAYLLHADARMHARGGRVLVVSPHDAYSAYVADVLPNLGEHEVQVATLAQLVPVPGTALEANREVARLKGSWAMVQGLQQAVSVFQQPPAADLSVPTDCGELWITPAQFSDAVAGLTPHVPHNEARVELRENLLEILLRQLPASAAAEPSVRRALRANTRLAEHLDEYWPVLDPQRLVHALYTTEELLHYCVPELSATQRQRLRTTVAASGWCASDLPLLDAARWLTGDPHAEAVRQRRTRQRAGEQSVLRRTIEELLEAADGREDLASQLIHEDLQEQLLAARSEPEATGDPLEGPFAHVVIDEAQDLSDAQWAMVLRRCPSGSLTIVGDRAQAVAGFTESWPQRLARLGLSRVKVAELTVNYRSTAQVMAAAAPVIRRELPDASIPVSLRTDGAPVYYGRPAELGTLLERWLSEHSEGVVAVIGDASVPLNPRVRVVTPEGAKGLEFDLVILWRPEEFGAGVAGAVRRYVAMTRATCQLVILTDRQGEVF